MKRADFLKRLGIGLGAVVVAPQVLAEMPAKEKPAFNTDLINNRINDIAVNKEPFSVGLFMDEKEVSYRGYERMCFTESELFLKRNGDLLSITPPNMIFPSCGKGEKVSFNNIKVYRCGKLMFISDLYSVMWFESGTCTVCLDISIWLA